jgi:hypothetical protein
MPLTCCPCCGLTVYSAAGHSTRDACPQCESPLPPGAASVNRELKTPRYLEVTATYLEQTGRAQAKWLRLGL